MMNHFESGLPETVEQVALQSHVPSLLFQRWLGAWIDFAVLASFLIIPDHFLGNAIYQKTMVIWLSFFSLYFPICEGLSGMTLGKLITRTIVVDSSGNPPGFWKATVRTLLRFIEVNPFLAGGIPAGIVVALSKKRQRLGDMLAGTFVVDRKELKELCERREVEGEEK